MKKVTEPSDDSSAPLSSAMEINGLLFVSGQIHADSKWNLIGTTIQEKFHTAIANVERVLSTAGFEKKDVLQVRLYLTDLSELADLNNAYKKYFGHPLPARSALEVSKLPLGASLEIEVVAGK